MTSFIVSLFFFARQKTTGVITKLVEYTNKFAMYNNDDGEYVSKLLDNFARRLFAWRRPYPKLKQSAVRRWLYKYDGCVR